MPARRRDPLTEYFQWLNREINAGNVRHESDLSRAVEITFVHPNTLLRVLGYNHDTVQAQCRVRLAATTLRVDFRVGGEENYWMLDLKSPREDCNLPRHVGQMQDYLKTTGMPLGVLFNGKQACAVINTEHRALKRYSTFAETAICITDAGDLQKLTEFFQEFQPANVRNSVVAIAQKLANEQKIQDKRKAAQKQRREKIACALKTAFVKPTPELVRCLTSLSALQEISVRQSEIRNVLQTLQLVERGEDDAPPFARQIRELVIEICGSHGFDFLQFREQPNRQFLKSPLIPKLRVRTDGHVDNGYKAVTGVGVPQGLTVGGVDGDDAREIIHHLKQIQAMPKTQNNNPPRGAAKSGSRKSSRS